MPQIDENQASPAADTFLRRFAAAALDVLFVALPALLLAVTSAERFTIIEQAGDRARFSVPDQLRINQIDEGLNRAMQLGDTVVTLSGAGLWLTLATLTILTVLVFFVVPGLQRGQTPGRSLMRLPIRADDKTDVELLAVSITDVTTESAFSTVGAAAAAPSAKTTTRVTRTSAVPKSDRSRAASRTATSSLSNGLPPVPRGESRELVNPDLVGADMVDDDMGFVVTELRTENVHVDVDVDVEQGLESASLGDANQELRELLQTGIKRGAPAVQASLGDDIDYDQWTDLNDLDLVDRHNNDGGRDNPFETLTLPESSLSETPLTASTGRNGGSASGQRGTATVDRATETRTEAPAVLAPEWSSELQSWVYRDETTDRWFRHDQSTNRWVPIAQ